MTFGDISETHKCPCGEKGFDGTQEHSHLLARVKLSSGTIYVCANHLDNYVIGNSRYYPNFASRNVQYLEQKFQAKFVFTPIQYEDKK